MARGDFTQSITLCADCAQHGCAAWAGLWSPLLSEFMCHTVLSQVTGMLVLCVCGAVIAAGQAQRVPCSIVGGRGSLTLGCSGASHAAHCGATRSFGSCQCCVLCLQTWSGQCSAVDSTIPGSRLPIADTSLAVTCTSSGRLHVLFCFLCFSAGHLDPITSLLAGLIREDSELLGRFAIL